MWGLKRITSGFTAALLAAASLLAFATPAQASSVTNGSNSSSSTFTVPTTPATPSLSNSQKAAFAYPGGVFEIGAPSAGSSYITVNAYKNGGLDTSFNSTGSVSFLSQLSTSNRSDLEITTYDSGTKWAILDANASAFTGNNYLYLGTFAGGYQSVITLPTTSSYTTTCTNKLNAVINSYFTVSGGEFDFVPDTGFAAPMLILKCYSYVTTNGSSYSNVIKFLVNYSGGTTLGTPATLNAVGGTAAASPANILNTTNRKTITNFGVSVNPAATGTMTAITFIDAMTSGTSYSNPMAYDSTPYTEYIVTRVSASGVISQTQGAWTGVLAGTRTGTVIVPPRNNGTVYAFLHATDGTAAVTKVLTFGNSGVATSQTSVTGLTLTAGINRIASLSNQAGNLKIASLNDGSPSYYFEVNATAATITQVSTFTTSGGFAASELLWAISDSASGAEFFSRSGTTTMLSVLALNTPIAPSQPIAPGGTRGNQEVYLSWTAPADNGTAITGYLIQLTTNGGTSYTLWATTGPVLATVLTGLTNGQNYQFRIAAVNSAGTSAYSSLTSVVIPTEVPFRPTINSVTYSSSSAVTLTWNTPNDGGHALISYQFSYSTNNGQSWNSWGAVNDPSLVSYTTPALNSFQTYIFKMVAFNSVGSSLFSYASPAYFVADLPGAPAAPTVVVADSQATVSWTAPAANGCAITAYRIDYTADNGTNWTTYSTTTSTTFVTVPSLANGIGYKFRVAAQNCDGWGALSQPSATATPSSVPPAPTGLTVSGGAGSRLFALSWNAVSSPSAVTDYRIEYSDTAGVNWAIYSDGVSTATTATAGSFLAGSPIRFRVSATNAMGTGTASTPSAVFIPAVIPAAPAAPTATVSPGSVTLTWVPPVDANAALTGAQVLYSSNLSSWTTYSGTVDTSGTVTVNGLTPGQTYYFRVKAANYFGYGAESATSSAVIAQAATAPATVTGVTSSPGASASSIDLSWTAPASNGSSITDYTIEYSSDGGVTWTTFVHAPSTATSATVTGLTAGTQYQFRVKAVNGVGASASASASTAPVAASSVSSNQTSTSDLIELIQFLKPSADVDISDGQFSITGKSLDEITQIYLNSIESKIIFRSSEILTIALPADVIGWVDVKFSTKSGSITFQDFVYVANNKSQVSRLGLGYKTISKKSAAIPKISTAVFKENAVRRLANVAPKVANATTATCIGYVGKGMTSKEALARARHTCEQISLRYPRMITKLAVSKSILRAHVLVLFKY